MKTLILLATVCLFGVASAAPATNGLDQDLRDFLDLLPIEKIKALAEKYVQDEEVQQAIVFMFSDDFAHIWAQLSASKEFREFVYYLDDAGLPVVEHLNRLANGLGLPEFPAQFAMSKLYAANTGGLKGFYDELLSLLPKEEIKALFNEKLKTSKAFAELYEKISSAEFQRVVKFVKDSPELTESFNKLRKHGIDVDHIVDVVCRIFGWKQ